jgi:hypothetical protein
VSPGRISSVFGAENEIVDAIAIEIHGTVELAARLVSCVQVGSKLRR